MIGRIFQNGIFGGEIVKASLDKDGNYKIEVVMSHSKIWGGCVGLKINIDVDLFGEKQNIKGAEISEYIEEGSKITFICAWKANKETILRSGELHQG